MTSVPAANDRNALRPQDGGRTGQVQEAEGAHHIGMSIPPSPFTSRRASSPGLDPGMTPFTGKDRRLERKR